MRKLFFLFVTATVVVSCSNTKSENDDKDDTKGKDEKRKDDNVSQDESSLGNWSDGDKDKLKKEWNTTFAKWKDGLQGEPDFDEADFDKEAKKVVSCTLNVLENKFTSYAKYKKANDRDHFQSDPELLNEMGNCTDRLMEKYNRNDQ